MLYNCPFDLHNSVNAILTCDDILTIDINKQLLQAALKSLNSKLIDATERI